MNTLHVTDDELQMLRESLDAVGWGADKELGKRAEKLKAKLGIATLDMSGQEVGIGNGQMKIGQHFESQCSDEWTVGQELTTWANYLVKVITKQETHVFGSWKYRYTFQVLALGPRAERRLRKQEVKA